TNSATIYYSLFNVNRTINAGPGNNIVNMSGLPASSSLAFNGGGGLDTLIAPDVVNTFDITAANQGSLTSVYSPARPPLSFSSVESLRGNTQSDTFRFGASGSLSETVDGWLGTDKLDYSAKTVPVSVNLRTGTATATRGVLWIENVTGGSRNDTLIGD